MEYLQQYEPLVWGYILSTLFTCLAMGLMFMRFCFIKSSSLGSFLSGVATVPSLQFLWTLVVTPIFIGKSKFLFILPLPILSLAVIVYLFSTKKVAVVNLFITVKATIIKKDPFTKVVFLLILGFCAYTVSMLFYNSFLFSTSTSFITSDNIEYFHKASYFANNRTLSSISYINGLPDGSGIADHHFPSYILYLSYAFMHTNREYIIYPHHAAPLIATFFQVHYLLAGAGAAFCAFSKRRMFVVMIPSLLFSNLILSISMFISPRDYFRFSIFYVFIAFLTNFSPTALDKSHTSSVVSSLNKIYFPS